MANGKWQGAGGKWPIANGKLQMAEGNGRRQAVGTATIFCAGYADFSGETLSVSASEW
jgi:hypothetical protein